MRLVMRLMMMTWFSVLICVISNVIKLRVGVIRNVNYGCGSEDIRV
jgi:hypothetical protein